MANWKEIWNNRECTYINDDDFKEEFKNMKQIDGFDILDDSLNYEAYLEQWNTMNYNLQSFYPEKKINSVFEVGCGSGPNLFLYQKLKKINKLGGIDYSNNLIEYAKNILKIDDLKCDEAINLNVEEKYDSIISNSVFSYFKDYEYARAVLQKMVQKCNYSIAILDIHDLNKKEDFIKYRKENTEDYEERYKGLDKLFYKKEFFLDFAEKNGLDIKFLKSNMKGYWNNDFIFNCYMYKV